jgi:hypothetical protein
MRTYLEVVVREPQLHERYELADFGRQVKQPVAVKVQLPNAVHLRRMQHTSAYVRYVNSIRQPVAVKVQLPNAVHLRRMQHTSAYVSIRQLPNAVHLRHRRGNV